MYIYDLLLLNKNLANLKASISFFASVEFEHLINCPLVFFKDSDS